MLVSLISCRFSVVVFTPLVTVIVINFVSQTLWTALNKALASCLQLYKSQYWHFFLGMRKILFNKCVDVYLGGGSSPG